MNEDMKTLDQGGSDYADSTSDSSITDFSRLVNYAAGNDRDARRRERIRAELVREHFSREQIEREQKAFPRPRSFLLKLFKLD